MTTQPARYIAALVGIVTAASAVVGVLASGGTTLAAIAAGLTSLAASLGGGEIVRANVEPVALARERRDTAVAEAAGGADVRPVDGDL